MEIHYKIIGVLLMLLALIHAIFPTYFEWKDNLKNLSLINKQMMQVHTFFIAFVVFLMGLLCFIASEDLIQTKLGKTVSLGLGIFWVVRLGFQLFIYDAKLWKGKTFETFVHVLFTGIWLYLSLVFFLAALC